MNHHDGPTVQPRADAFYRLHDDVMPILEAHVPAGRCRRACSECLCIGKGTCPRLPAPVFQRTRGRALPKTRRKIKSERGARDARFQPFFAQVSEGRLEVMNAHTREQLADRSNASICPHSGPLLPRRHLARRLAPLSVAFSPSRRRPCGHVPFDGAGVVPGIVAASGDHPLSCAREATAGKRCGSGRVG